MMSYLDALSRRAPASAGLASRHSARAAFAASARMAGRKAGATKAP